MNNIEKEIRIKLTKSQINKIRMNTETYKDRYRIVDITMGKKGFESLKKYGYICRVRCKNERTFIEIKKYIDNNTCIESSINVKSLEEGIKFFSLLDLKIYLILDRYREVRKFNSLLIYIDEFEDLGNYIEIEYQDSNFTEAQHFLKNLNLPLNFEEKYGDIVKNKLKSNNIYREKYNKKIKEYIIKQS